MAAGAPAGGALASRLHLGEVLAGKRLHIRTQHRNLRIKEDGSVDGGGAEGPWATFTPVPGSFIKLQSVGNPSNWLRIDDKGELNGKGSGGPWCEFQVVPHGSGVVSLKSVKYADRENFHVGVQNGKVRRPAETGTGKFGRFQVKLFNPATNESKDVDGVDPFKEVYPGVQVIFYNEEYKKALRIQEDGDVDGEGGSGVWARFHVHICREIRFRNVGKPEHWLRINESKALDGKGSGGPWTVLEIVKTDEKFVLQSKAHKSKNPERFHVGILPDGAPKDPEDTGRGRAAQVTFDYAD